MQECIEEQPQIDTDSHKLIFGKAAQKSFLVLSFRFNDGFGQQQDLFADAFADVRQREPDWDKLGQLEICAYALRKIVADDFYLVRVGAAELHFPRRFNNRQVIRVDVDQFGTDSFTGDWLCPPDEVT